MITSFFKIPSSIPKEHFQSCTEVLHMVEVGNVFFKQKCLKCISTIYSSIYLNLINTYMALSQLRICRSLPLPISFYPTLMKDAQCAE